MRKKELLNQVILNPDGSENTRVIIPLQQFQQILSLLGVQVSEKVSGRTT